MGQSNAKEPNYEVHGGCGLVLHDAASARDCHQWVKSYVGHNDFGGHSFIYVWDPKANERHGEVYFAPEDEE